MTWIGGAAAAVMFLAGCGSDESPAILELGNTASAEPIDTGSGEGLVVIDGTEYRFSATTCEVTDDLLAEGPGETDGRAFFVSVDASGSVDVAFDVASGVDTPPEDAPFFQGVDDDGLHRRGRTIVGEAVFVNANGDLADELDGWVEVTCDL